MKVSDQFILREIAGEHILVPVGAAAVKFNGLITMNDMGCFLFSQLRQEQTEEELLESILKEYEVDRDTALTDLREFMEQLRRIGALEEAK